MFEAEEIQVFKREEKSFEIRPLKSSLCTSTLAFL